MYLDYDIISSIALNLIIIYYEPLLSTLPFSLKCCSFLFIHRYVAHTYNFFLYPHSFGPVDVRFLSQVIFIVFYENVKIGSKEHCRTSLPKAERGTWFQCLSDSRKNLFIAVH